VADREEFERRLLALVRDFLDEADEESPGGYDIEDFIVVYQMRYAPDAEQPLQPWHGGQRPGWYLAVAHSSSCGHYWQDEAMLAEALDLVRNRRSDLRLGRAGGLGRTLRVTASAAQP
jgi:hypothetical protein